MIDLISFDHSPRTRIVFGQGSIERIGALAGELGAQRALIVTDAGIAAAGHVDRAKESLHAAGIAVAVFDRVRENPTTLDVDFCVDAAKAHSADSFIGLGGGSSLDTAKGANFLLTNGGKMADYWGVGLAKQPMMPMIAVPTTAGTGSECQSFALIADEVTHQKMACGDAKAAPRIALLDPELTITQPFSVTACTGIDAIAHAVETAVTRRRTPISALYSREALRLTINNIRRALEAPSDLEARSAMLLGAAYAGIAIENSMLGIAHSCANPLTAEFGIVHGQAVGMMLPHVVRFNAEDAVSANGYLELAIHAGIATSGASTSDAVSALAGRIEECLTAAGFPEGLSGCGVTPDAISKLAEGAAKQWTAQFNPRQATIEDFATLYSNAL